MSSAISAVVGGIGSAVGAVGSAIGGIGSALGITTGAQALGAIGSAVGIANGVNTLLSDAPSGVPGGGYAPAGGSGGVGGAGGVGPANLTAGMTAPSTGVTPIDLGGHFAAPSLYATNAPRYYADGGPIDFEPVEETPQGGLSATEHNPEFYSEGGLKNTYVKGEGDGTSDSVPAMLATGEFVIPSDVVSSLGNGSNDSGSKVLDEFLKTIREHKYSNRADKLPPDSKGPLEYISISKRKVNI
jgi:hypothetical protein